MRLREVTRCNEFPSGRGRSGLGIGAAPSMGSRGEMGFPKRTGTHSPVGVALSSSASSGHAQPKAAAASVLQAASKANTRCSPQAGKSLTLCRDTASVALSSSACNRGCFQPFAGQLLHVTQFGSKGSSSSNLDYGNQERRLRSWGEIVDLWSLFLALL